MPAHAEEIELEDAPPPRSADEIQGHVESQFEPRPETRLRMLAPGLLDDLPPFLRDSSLRVRLRSRYRNRRRFDDERVEAWAGGGSLRLESGWLEDAAAVELEYFTSQRLKGDPDRGGSGYLEAGQHGFGVLGIANLKLRHEAWSLTAYRQALDLPYVNGDDSRMVPNTFEAVTVRRDGERLDWIGGHIWRIKPQDTDDFVSIGEIEGGSEERGLSVMALKWDPTPGLYAGLFGYYGRDIGTVTYTETSWTRELGQGVVTRLEGQGTWGKPTSDALFTDGDRASTWQVGLRGSASWRGLLAQLAATHVDDGRSIASPLGGSPSYLDRMQHGFTRAGEDALGVALSWSFAEQGAPGLSLHGNVTQGFGGRNSDGTRSDRLETDLSLDYKPDGGRWRGFWLRLRGSVLYDDEQQRTQNEVRVELQYDFEGFGPAR